MASTGTTPCSGPCNTSWRRAEQGSDPHQLTPTWGEPLWCHSCSQRFTRALADFPRIAAEIRNQALHGTPRRTSSTHTPAGARPWPGQTAHLLADEICGSLTDLEDDVRQLRSLTARPHRGREGPTITGAVAFLTAHAEWITTHHPIAEDPHDAPPAHILRLHARAVRFTGDSAPRLEIRPLPCPGCGCLSLAQQSGGKYIECGMPDCGRLFTEAEYHDYASKEAARHRQQRSS